MSGPAGIRAFLDARCARRTDACFLWHRGRTWSYAELGALTDGAAAAFLRLGLARGDRVALLLPNAPEAIFTWLALAKIGAVTAPIHPQLTAAEVAGVLAWLEPKALVLDASLADRVPCPPAGTRLIGPELDEVLSSRDPLVGVDPPGPDDAADILMTSGTTGRPKGVVQSHRSYVLTGEAFAHWLALTPDDRLFTCLPLSHINARAYSTMGALASGASLALEEHFSASRFWGWLAGSGATQCNAIGAMLQILMQAPPSDADRAHRVRLVYSAPALGHDAHLAFEQRFGVRLVIGYGLSESTFGFIHPLDGERRLDSMGRIRSHPDPRFGNEARLVADGRDVDDGEVGEIWLRNPATFAGYFRDEAATGEALAPGGWLKTGDLARRDAAGWRTFVARRKEIIRRRGENIAPAEVEAVLTSHPAVKEAAVVGVPSALGEEEVAAFVVLDPQTPATREEIRAHAAARLAPFKVPSIWRFLDALPRTSTQRVAKHLLKPESEPEQRIAELARELEQAHAEMKAFTQSISHDLRAPLRAVGGFAQALLEDYADRLDEEGRDMALRIVGAAKEMDTLILDLVEYSRVTSKDIPVGPVRLKEALDDALEQLREPVLRSGARVTVAPHLPAVMAHRATLGQVIAHLLSNAIKFVAPGVAPQVRVGAEERSGWVRLWVQDNGIGMAIEDQGRIFGIFERLHGRESYPGTGIGLALVRRGVERMGGRFGVESQPGEGSRFWIELRGEPVRSG